MGHEAVVRYISYAIMLALVGAGLAGLLQREAVAGGDMDDLVRAEYPRVTRQGLKPSLTVEVRNPGPPAAAPVVTLASDYLGALQLGGVTPDPDSATPVGDGLVRYAFAPLAGGARLRAVFAFSIDQQASGLRFSSPLRVALGGRLLLEDEVRTLVLP